MAMNRQLLIGQYERRIRIFMGIFITGLVLSGLTAFPLEAGLRLLEGLTIHLTGENNPVHQWIALVSHALQTTYSRYPFLGYGTDWLAFGHLVISLFFLGPLMYPGHYTWNIKCGMIACCMVLPLAFIAGHVRHIPLWWRLIDCSFGVLGIIPLGIVLKLSERLCILKEELPAKALYKQKGAME